MATTSPGGKGAKDPSELISDEIARSRREATPTSRQALAELIHDRIGTPVHEALQIVDAYCEDKEPGIPYYLQEEIAIPYLKFVAALFIIAAIGFFWYGVGVWRMRQPAHVWFSLGTVIAGLGVFAWVQSLEKYAERRRKKRTARS